MVENVIQLLLLKLSLKEVSTVTAELYIEINFMKVYS